MRMALAASSLLITSACGLLAQPAAKPPEFEVASVKSSPATSEGMRIRRNSISDSPGGITILNASLKAAVQWAYHLQAIQVIGPGWLDSGRFDIIAKTAGPASNPELRQMLQTLLADRFKLACHRETKEMKAYVITVAKGGHKLTPSEGEGEMQVKPTGKGLNIQFTHVTMDRLAAIAESPLDGVVVDQTGLKGAWDFTIDGSFFAMQKPADLAEAIGMMIQLLNEQLGIKVEQKKVATEIMIVDHAEKAPVEN